MRQLKYPLKLLFLVILFLALCAGMFSFIPLFGVCTYVLLFLMLFFMFAENQFSVKKYFCIFILAFLWLTALLVIKRLGTFAGLYAWFLGGMIVFSLTLMERFDTDSVWLFLFCSFMISLFFCLIEMCTGFHLPTSRFSKLSLVVKSYFGLYVPSFYFTNENDFCGYFVVAFFLCRLIDHCHRLIYDIFLFPIVFFIIFIAGARLCMIALFVYYFFIIMMHVPKKKRAWLYIVATIIVAFVFLKYALPYISNMRNAGSAKSLIIRVNLLIVSLQNIFVQHNFLGLGPSSFPSIIGSSSMTSDIIDPHNWFMELAIEAGLPFLILYIYFILTYLRHEKCKEYKATFIAFLICNFCSSRFSGILWNWFFLAFFVKRFFLISRKEKCCSDYSKDM